jgi:hypothetical protein
VYMIKAVQFTIETNKKRIFEKIQGIRTYHFILLFSEFVCVPPFGGYKIIIAYPWLNTQ